MTFSELIPSHGCGRQKENLLLDVWGQMQQVHDLCHAWLGDVGDCGQVRLRTHDAIPQELVEPNREGHKAGYAGYAARRGVRAQRAPAVPRGGRWGPRRRVCAAPRTRSGRNG